jgi:hypothetical protein
MYALPPGASIAWLRLPAGAHGWPGTAFTALLETLGGVYGDDLEFRYVPGGDTASWIEVFKPGGDRLDLEGARWEDGTWRDALYEDLPIETEGPEPDRPWPGP